MLTFVLILAVLAVLSLAVFALTSLAMHLDGVTETTEPTMVVAMRRGSRLVFAVTAAALAVTFALLFTLSE